MLFLKKIRSVDPMVPILWPSENSRTKAENHQLEIDENHVVVHNHLHTWPQKMDIPGPKLGKRNMWHYRHLKKLLCHLDLLFKCGGHQKMLGKIARNAIFINRQLVIFCPGFEIFRGP